VVSVYIDIDGCLVDYPSNEMLEFFHRKNSVDVSAIKNIQDLKNCLSKEEYNTTKNEYRRSGIKRNLKVIDAAKDAINTIKQFAEIIILTSRPIQEQNVINTKHWLLKNSISHDKLLFVRHKDDFLPVPNNGSKIFIIDDDPLFLSQYKKYSNTYGLLYSAGKPLNTHKEKKTRWDEITKFIQNKL